MKRKLLAGILVGLVAITLIVPLGCKEAAEFELSSLRLPEVVGAGESATVEAEVANVAEAEGTYRATLKVNGMVMGTTDVTLRGGEKQTISFTVTQDVVGAYDVELNGLSGRLTVKEPAEFEVSSLVITPTSALPGEDITVKVDVKNVGGVQGVGSVALSVDGKQVETKDAIVPAGATRAVSFTLAKSTPGTHGGEVNGLRSQIAILKPAEFQVDSLAITPAEVLPTEEVMIEVDVANTGGVEGTHSLTLLIDGAKIESKDIAVAAGATETVSFKVTRNIPSSYAVEVEVLAGAFVVQRVPERTEGEEGEWLSDGRTGVIVDEVIKRKSPEDPEKSEYLIPFRVMNCTGEDMHIREITVRYYPPANVRISGRIKGWYSRWRPESPEVLAPGETKHLASSTSFKWKPSRLGLIINHDLGRGTEYDIDI